MNSSTERLRATLGADQRPTTDLALQRLAETVRQGRDSHLPVVFTGETMAGVLARLVAVQDELADVRARYTALADEATALLLVAQGGPGDDGDDAPDNCPVGDPECDAPNDGEWHCHDACEAPAPGTGQ